MRFLFVNNIFPLFAKADSGASVRSMRIIDALTQIGHVDVISFLNDEKSNIDNCDVIYSQFASGARALPSIKEKIQLALHRYSISDVWPVNESKQSVIRTAIGKKKYDVIVVRYIDKACECGLLEYADRLIVDVDDDPKSVVRLHQPVSSFLSKIFWHHFYANAVESVTLEVLSRVKGAFNSQPEKHYPNTTYLPNISKFSTSLPNVDFSVTQENILFIGKMDHKPNIQALDHFLKCIFPILQKSHPNAIVRVVGKIVDSRLLQLCHSIPNVVLCGFVDDIITEYDVCRCVVVPLLSGTGTSVKLVEAMSLNRAVVTTTIGKRGLHEAFAEGNDFLLADKDEDFAYAISRLLDDEHLNHKVANSACQKVKRYYSEEMFNHIVKNVIFNAQ